MSFIHYLLSFIQSCNFNHNDFLKLRNFYYDLVFLNRRPHNNKNKNVEKKLLVPHANASPKMWPLRAKTVLPPKQQFLRNSFPPAERGEDTMCSILSNFVLLLYLLCEKF